MCSICKKEENESNEEDNYTEIHDKLEDNIEEDEIGVGSGYVEACDDEDDIGGTSRVRVVEECGDEDDIGVNKEDRSVTKKTLPTKTGKETFYF